IAIADVSGKGVAAALTMANLHAMLVCLSKTSSTVAECVAAANQMLCDFTTPGRFATMFYAVLDLTTRKLAYCNAGHNYPLLLRKDGGIDHLETGGVPVGFMPDWKYQEGDAQ